MAIKQETIMAVIAAGKSYERMFLGLQEKVVEAMAGKEPGEALGELFLYANSLHPNPVHVALLAKLEQYYVMARHKNNYKRRWEAKRSGREVEPVQVPKGFAADRMPSNVKTLQGYGDPKVMEQAGSFVPSAELQSEVDRIIAMYEEKDDV